MRKSFFQYRKCIACRTTVYRQKHLNGTIVGIIPIPPPPPPPVIGHQPTLSLSPSSLCVADGVLPMLLVRSVH
jgi:hypothetical protein